VTPLCVGVKEAAAMLNVSAWTIRQWIASGELPTVKLPSVKYEGEQGKRILIHVDDLRNFVSSRPKAVVQGWRQAMREAVK